MLPAVCCVHFRSLCRPRVFPQRPVLRPWAAELQAWKEALRSCRSGLIVVWVACLDLSSGRLHCYSLRNRVRYFCHPRGLEGNDTAVVVRELVSPVDGWLWAIVAFVTAVRLPVQYYTRRTALLGASGSVGSGDVHTCRHSCIPFIASTSEFDSPAARQALTGGMHDICRAVLFVEGQHCHPLMMLAMPYYIMRGMLVALCRCLSSCPAIMP
jgi:hypothetical protein